MRKVIPESLNKYRLRQGMYKSDDSYGLMGCFTIPSVTSSNQKLIVISSGPADSSTISKWEHVSVSVFKSNRLPNWPEMCSIKDFFWSEEETVIQFHPKKSENVSNAEVLHLWKDSEKDFELPSGVFVGIKK